MSSLLPAKLKTIVPDFQQELKYTDENEKEIIVTIAERIASIYADFLTSAGQDKRSSKLKFYDFPTFFPSNNEVNCFKNNLKAKIIEKLSVGSTLGNSIKLAVDHIPIGALDDVLDNSSIGMNSKYCQYLLHFFPMKSSTTISKNPAAHTIQIEMQTFDRGL